LNSVRLRPVADTCRAQRLQTTAAVPYFGHRQDSARIEPLHIKPSQLRYLVIGSPARVRLNGVPTWKERNAKANLWQRYRPTAPDDWGIRTPRHLFVILFVLANALTSDRTEIRRIEYAGHQTRRVDPYQRVTCDIAEQVQSATQANGVAL